MKATFNSVFIQSFQFSRCCLLSSSAKYSGNWIDAISGNNFGGLLSSDELHVSIPLRARADICMSLLCHSGRLLDSTGLHGLPCYLNAGHFTHHMELNLILKRSFCDGLTLCSWLQGRYLVWDVSVSNSFASPHILDAVVK